MKKRKIIKYGILGGFLYLFFVTFSGPAVTETGYSHILGAHRGDWGNYIENTLEGIEAAVENPDYKFIEFDVQYTKDKKPVVFHDKTLLRMQHLPFSIKNLTYDEVEMISDYHIPLYDEAAKEVAGKKKINVEIKSFGDLSWDIKLVDYVVGRAINGEYIKDLMLSSISGDVVSYINNAYPYIKTGQVFFTSPSTYLGTEYLTNGIYEKAEENGADYVLLYGSNTRNIENLIALKPKDQTIMIWYFNNELYILQKDEEDRLW